MIFAIAAAAGLIVALARGLPLAAIAERRFRGFLALAAAFGLHLFLNPLVIPSDFASQLVASPLVGIPSLGNLLYLGSLACALAFLYVNRRLPGFPLILAGLALNFAVIAASGGQMPADPSQLEKAGLLTGFLAGRDAGRWSPFTVLGPGAPLSFLSDIIFVPMPFREPTVASLGDIVIALGVFAFFNPLPPRVREASAFEGPN
jgi:hypothetical protein